MQVYVVVMSGDKVLVAKKKTRGARFGGERTGPAVLNYAGQWVFPGGKVEKSDRNPEQAAMREFHEETGYDLRGGEVHMHYDQIDKYHGILFVEPENIDIMATQINRNIERDATRDDELESVAVMAKLVALGRFTDWIDQDPEVERELQRRARGGDYRDRGWFSELMR